VVYNKRKYAGLFNDQEQLFITWVNAMERNWRTSFI